jgi:hypothetical protein
MCVGMAKRNPFMIAHVLGESELEELYDLNNFVIYKVHNTI